MSARILGPADRLVRSCVCTVRALEVRASWALGYWLAELRLDVGDNVIRSFAVSFYVVIVAIAAACACQQKPASGQYAVVPQRDLVGQVLLPLGDGSRGVEVVITVTEAGSEPRDRWLLFDEQGRFAHTFREDLISVTVSTGIRAELHRIDTDELPEVHQAGQIDVGVIDLRDRLTRHRLVLRATEGTPPGDVRVAMCFGPPPVGPGGERIALGSRQFPQVALGSEVEWLLPHEAKSIYFLVERPIGSGRGREWRSGRQRLFGPFSSATLPTELIID